MTPVSITAFWIHELLVWGQWSPIHILAYSRTMIALFLLALVITGDFTLLPGRIMHEVLPG